jgi:FAD/FMN-containing dehydrogenase
VKTYTRKQFIQLSAAAGAAIFLGACGENGNKKEAGKITQAAGTPSIINHSNTSSPSLDLVDKNDARYNALRQGFNKRIDKCPQVIAVCATTQEVAAAIRYGQEKGLPIAVKSGGHSMEGFSCNDGGMVINLSKMNRVEMLGGDKIKAGPGCTISSLYDVILPQGRLLPAGSCGTVGIGGLTLGGGYGLFARKYGLTCDHLLEAIMVDGNGNIHSTKNDEELLWALKGGGTGNFGVVTEMIFHTQAAPVTLQAHYFKARNLTPEKAAAILQTWMELAAQLPASCFSGYVLNGSTLNILITNYEPPTDNFLAQLNKLAGAVDEFHSSQPGSLARMLHNYYGRQGPVCFRNSSAGFFKDFNDISGFISQVFEITVHTPGMIYQVNTLGGKIKDGGFEKLSSYPHRAFDFVSELQGYCDNAAQDKRIAEATTQVLKITEQHGITRQYVNYCSLEFSNWENAYYGENYSRLQAIKRKYDPGNNIRHPQSIKV